MSSYFPIGGHSVTRTLLKYENAHEVLKALSVLVAVRTHSIRVVAKCITASLLSVFLFFSALYLCQSLGWLDLFARLNQRLFRCVICRTSLLIHVRVNLCEVVRDGRLNAPANHTIASLYL